MASPTQKDNGTYECVAESSAGQNTRTIDLLVQIAPRISPQSDRMEPLHGSEIILKCEVTAIPVAKIKWFKDNGSINRTHSISDSITYIENNSSIRMITDLSSTGKYVCVASNEVGRDTLEINVVVRVPPSFEERKEIITVSKGDTLTLSCLTDAVPQAAYYWRKEPIEESTQNYGVITFPSVDLDFTGIYLCEAINEVGNASKIFNVTVKSHPKITTDLLDRHISKIGNDIYKYCSAEGYPIPVIKWLKNGKKIAHLTEGKLEIQGAKKEDEGIYTCVAENQDGIDQRHMEILVEAPPEMDESFSHEVEVNEKETLTIFCPVVNSIRPTTIKWMKNGKAITPNRNTIPSEENRSLTIKKVRRNDKGNYSCNASNAAGASQAFISVEVYSAPIFTLRTYDEKIESSQGASLNLDCTNFGHPIPKVSWFRNKHPVIPDLRLRADIISHGQIMRIINATKAERGVYKCIVENRVGQVEKTFNVKIIVPVNNPAVVGLQPGWGPWSPWSNCSSLCGHSQQVRTRKCKNDIAPCKGSPEDWRNCEVGGCKVNGGWSAWGKWSMCTKSCGSGTRFRDRSCSKPEPRNGGNICNGNHRQHDICNTGRCPIDGSWSKWTEWQNCFGTCSNSTQKLSRTCTRPSPAFGGRPCLGDDVQYVSCIQKNCPVHGGWSEWSDWSPCTTTCGHSASSRNRSCNNPTPKLNGAFCKGSSKDTRKCEVPLCDDIPHFATLSITGSLNGQEVPGLISSINIKALKGEMSVHAYLNNSLKYKSKGWYPYLSHAVAPVTWLTALQMGNGINGYLLTKGIFKMLTTINFETGENLTINHVGHGLDSSRTLIVHVEFNGKTPLFPNDSPMKMEPYEENYIQTEPGELYVRSQNSLESGGTSISYSWTKLITYTAQPGKLPSLVEKLNVQNIKVKRNKHIERGKITIQPSICPPGFLLSKQGYCADVNECSKHKLNNCHFTQTCINHKGFYSCSCPPGMTAPSEGGECVDIDECTLRPAVCSHVCENLKGGFRCLCPPGQDLLDSKTTCSYIFPRSYGKMGESRYCKDPLVNVEGVCREYEPCKYNKDGCSQEDICININGLQNCIEYPCPPNFRRINNSSICIKYCNNTICETGAQVSEKFTPIVLTINEAIEPYKNITRLTMQTNDSHKKIFRIIQNEKEKGKDFRIKLTKDFGTLYSTKFLPAGIHRVAVLASAFDDNGRKILHTNRFEIIIRTQADYIDEYIL